MNLINIKLKNDDFKNKTTGDCCLKTRNSYRYCQFYNDLGENTL